jgi:hypothetical protein
MSVGTNLLLSLLAMPLAIFQLCGGEDTGPSLFPLKIPADIEHHFR